MDSILKQMKPLHILGYVLAFFVAIWILRCLIGWFSPEYFTGIGGNTYTTDCTTGCLIQNGTLLNVLDTAGVVLANKFTLNADGSYSSASGTTISRVPNNCECASLDPITGKWTAGQINSNYTTAVNCTTRTGVTITDLLPVINPTAYAAALKAAADALLAASQKAVTDATTADTAAKTAKTTADAAAAAKAAADAAAAKAAADAAAKGDTDTASDAALAAAIAKLLAGSSSTDTDSSGTDPSSTISSLAGINPSSTSAAQVLLNTLKPTLTTCKNAYNIHWV